MFLRQSQFAAPNIILLPRTFATITGVSHYTSSSEMFSILANRFNQHSNPKNLESIQLNLESFLKKKKTNTVYNQSHL